MQDWVRQMVSYGLNSVVLPFDIFVSAKSEDQKTYILIKSHFYR